MQKQEQTRCVLSSTDCTDHEVLTSPVVVRSSARLVLSLVVVAFLGCNNLADLSAVAADTEVAEDGGHDVLDVGTGDSTHPDATEHCIPATERCDNNLDDDCDGEIDEGANGCGGCEELEAAPGTPCDDDVGCRLWQCDGENALQCDRGNACGGCQPLPGSPGQPCGDDECGFWACQDDGRLECKPEYNECGGCGDLPGRPGDECACGGTWQCQDSTVVCTGEINACGGCGELQGMPGEPCDQCAVWECQAGSVQCVQAETNPCGGCGALEGGYPQDECGPSGCGTWTCVDSNTTVCQLGQGCPCSPTDPLVGDGCGPPDGCNRWTCTDGTLECNGIGTTNACGGCGMLEHSPGDPCTTSNDQCGVYTCDDETDELVCVPSTDGMCGCNDNTCGVGYRCNLDSGYCECNLAVCACNGIPETCTRDQICCEGRCVTSSEECLND